MTKLKGFTVFELMIVLAILGVISVIVWPMWQGALSFNEVVRGEECIHGLRFLTDSNGSRIQVVGTNGFAVACTQ